MHVQPEEDHFNQVSARRLPASNSGVRISWRQDLIHVYAQDEEVLQQLPVESCFPARREIWSRRAQMAAENVTFVLLTVAIGQGHRIVTTSQSSSDVTPRTPRD